MDKLFSSLLLRILVTTLNCVRYEVPYYVWLHAIKNHVDTEYKKFYSTQLGGT